MPQVEIACIVANVRFRPRIEQILREHSPVVVFHAAAYKHVPLMEEHNVWEAVRNNVRALMSSQTAQPRLVSKNSYCSRWRRR